MEIPTPPTLAALARLIRERLAGMQGGLGPLRDLVLWAPRDVQPPIASAPASAQVAGVVVAAAAPYAPNSYARTRLIRQMHAAGMLSDVEAGRAEDVLGAAE